MKMCFSNFGMEILVQNSNAFQERTGPDLRPASILVSKFLQSYPSVGCIRFSHVRVVATRKCRINCNETLSPPRLSNGRQSRTAGKVVDAGHRGFSFLGGSDVHRTAVCVFLQGQRPSEQQSVPAIDAQYAIELMGEFHGFSGIAAR